MYKGLLLFQYKLTQGSLVEKTGLKAVPMGYQTIQTAWQYNFTAERIKQLKGAAPRTPEADELYILAELLVE